MSSRLLIAEQILESCGPEVTGERKVALSRSLWDLPLQTCLTENQLYGYIKAVRLKGTPTKQNTTVPRALNICCDWLERDALTVYEDACKTKQKTKEREKQRRGSDVGDWEVEVVADDGDKRRRAKCPYSMLDVFPLKKNPCAVTKVHCRTDNMYQGLVEDLGAKRARGVLKKIWLRRYVEGRPTYADEAAGWLLWVACAMKCGFDADLLVDQPYSFLKELSNVVKGLGVANTPWGNLIVEMGALAGRSVAPVDIDVEMRKRCEPDTFPGMLAPFGVDDVTRAVDAVVTEELHGDIKLGSFAEWLRGRFSTTKAGSHHAAKWEKNEKLPRAQLTRRNYVEAVSVEDVVAKEPGGYVSFSEKLEHGKTRAIYSLDSDNYLRFDGPAREVERHWSNRRAMLRPATDYKCRDQAGVMNRLRRYKFMLDYADFNSAHTLESQKIVVRRVFRGLDGEWLNWLVDSFDNMWLRDPRVDKSGPRGVRKVAGTLMSGHRLTSIINTILNAAYVRLAVGEEVYARMDVMHVGDDVLANGDDPAVMQEAVRRMLASGLNLQKEKQGFGRYSAEFLRITTTKYTAMGYVPRAIASTVSGNWINPNPLTKKEIAATLMQNLWTVANRTTRYEQMGVMWRDVSRLLGVSECDARKVARFELSVDGSPVLHGRNSAVMLCLQGGTSTSRVQRTTQGVRLSQLAYQDYVDRSSEFRILRMIGVPEAVMASVALDASYSNMGIHEESDHEWSRDERFMCTRVRLSITPGASAVKRDQPGVLAGLLGNRMTPLQWAEYAAITGKDVAYLGEPPRSPMMIFASLGTTYADVRAFASNRGYTYGLHLTHDRFFYI